MTQCPMVLMPRGFVSTDGLMMSSPSRTGVTTTFAYDGFGREVAQTDGRGNTTRAVYDSLGRVASTVDAMGQTTAYGYDALGRRTSSTDPLGNSTFTSYDAEDRVVATRGATYTVDYPNGLTASWTYDANGQLLQVRNATPMGVISQYDYTYDVAGRRTAMSRSGSAMSESRTDAYGYNVRNELTSATKLGGPASVPASHEYAYQYDDIGNRITSTDLGTNRTYVANNLNQYTLISNLCASVTLCDGFFPLFDDDGNQTLIQTSTGIWSVQYNGENRPVLWTGGTQAA